MSRLNLPEGDPQCLDRQSQRELAAEDVLFGLPDGVDDFFGQAERIARAQDRMSDAIRFLCEQLRLAQW